MIVATMSLEEKAAHVRAEVPSVMRKFDSIIGKGERTVRKARGMRSLEEHYTYQSPRGIDWEVTVVCAKNSSVLFMTAWWHLERVGLEAMSLAPLHTYYFDTHFFQRYRERFSGTADPAANVRAFIQNNYDLKCMVLKSERHGHREVLVAGNDGLMLGTQRNGVLACDTYLSPKLLRPEQLAAYERLRTATVRRAPYLDPEAEIMRALQVLKKAALNKNI